MKRRAVIDAAIGETRAAVYEGSQLVELHTRRWTDKNRPHFGDIFSGQITQIDPSIGGAFVDMGVGPHGLLKFTESGAKAPRLTEGQWIVVRVKREAMADKGPVLGFEAESEDKQNGPKAQLDLTSCLELRFQGDLEFETASVGSLYSAFEPAIAIPGGGDIEIERTRAMITVDVDKGASKSGFNSAMAACPIIAAQLRLRGLGGLIAIDFPNIRQADQRQKLMDSLSDSFKLDPNPVKFAPLSRFGILEMTRGISIRSLDEICLDRYGQLTVESRALSLLAQAEKEARIQPGAQLEIGAPDPIYTWLEGDQIGWQSALQSRIGARFKMVLANEIYVKGDR